MIGGNLSRRGFIQLSLASTAVLLFGVPTLANDLGRLEQVIQSFPDVPLVASDNPPHLTFFMHTGELDSGQFGVKISNVVVDCQKPYDIQTLLSEDITELTFDEPRHNVSAVVSGANRVARQTRRGRGNHYAVMSDHILVWYKGKSAYDTPLQRAGNNLAYNPHYEDYFVRVKGVSLTRDDHNILKTIGYERVV